MLRSEVKSALARNGRVEQVVPVREQGKAEVTFRDQGSF